MSNELLIGLAALITAFQIGPLIAKKIRSRNEDATTAKTTAEEESIQVATAVEVVKLVRDDLNIKIQTISKLELKAEDFESRIKLLEVRERSRLVTDAITSSWIQMAGSKLSILDKDFPTFVDFLKDQKAYYEQFTKDEVQHA